MLNINPLLLVGGVIGAVTALLIFAYASVKDKKTAMGFERTMADGEILRRLFAYAKPYWAKFLLVLFLKILPHSSGYEYQKSFIFPRFFYLLLYQKN